MVCLGIKQGGEQGCNPQAVLAASFSPENELQGVSVPGPGGLLGPATAAPLTS
jgi:hypothetical protein